MINLIFIYIHINYSLCNLEIFHLIYELVNNNILFLCLDVYVFSLIM